MKDILICMGSSCFARGNEKNLRVIEEFIAKNELTAKIRVAGKCCAGHCAKGPNIEIDGVCHHNVTRESLIDLLNENIKRN
jgi:NADH:ubiquinone oxidoreductase subunit E